AEQRLPFMPYEPIRGDAARWRLAEHEIDAVLSGPGDWFAAEQRNLAPVVIQACKDTSTVDIAWELAAASGSFFLLRSFHDELRQVHLAALTACAQAGRARGEAAMIRGITVMRIMAARYEEAVADAERALRIFAETGDECGRGSMLGLRAILRRKLGDTSAAIADAQASLRIARAGGFRLMEYLAQHTLASILRERGDLAGAAGHAAQALSIARALSQPAHEVAELITLGAIHRERGRFEDSERHFTEALRIARGVGHRVYEANALVNLARSRVISGSERAEETLAESLSLSRQLNLPFANAANLHTLGILARGQDRADDALRHLETAVRMWRAQKATFQLACTLEELGRTFAELGNADRAREAWREAHAWFDSLGNAAKAQQTAGLMAGVRRRPR
ncbi:MAG: tetratricopeptide repeat protein, partial [Thermobispora bispora]|nr:tetratricopeptide repeat protein [Thermobispora bispora]